MTQNQYNHFSNFIILATFQCDEKLYCITFININYYYNKIFMYLRNVIIDK